MALTRLDMKARYVRIFDEDGAMYRPVLVKFLGNGRFELLEPEGGYDADIETWEFPPGHIVRFVEHSSSLGKILVAASLDE